VLPLIQLSFSKKEKRKVDKYEASENIKEETDDSEIKESQIEFFTAVQKLEK
jgi:hypothetical protein